MLGDAYAEHRRRQGLNQAVAAARSGAEVAFVGCLGDDDAGRRMRAVLADDGIDAGAVLTVGSSRPAGR